MHNIIYPKYKYYNIILYTQTRLTLQVYILNAYSAYLAMSTCTGTLSQLLCPVLDIKCFFYYCLIRK